MQALRSDIIFAKSGISQIPTSYSYLHLGLNSTQNRVHVYTIRFSLNKHLYSLHDKMYD